MIIWSCIYQKERCFPFNVMTGRAGRPKVWTQTPQTEAPSMPATQMLEGTICFSYAFEHTLNVILVHNKNECSVFQMHLLSSSFHTRWLYIMLKPHIQYASAHWSCWKWPCIFFLHEQKMWHLLILTRKNVALSSLLSYSALPEFRGGLFFLVRSVWCF